LLDYVGYLVYPVDYLDLGGAGENSKLIVYFGDAPV